jgi:hypothetical protein
MKIKLVINLDHDRYREGLDDPDITILTDELHELIATLERNIPYHGILDWHFEREEKP